MKWPKRIILFLATNIAVIAIASVTLSVFQVAPYLSEAGLNLQSLLIFAAVFGFAGSLFSLFISKWMAKQAFGVRIVTNPTSQREQFVYDTVARIAQQANIRMPEVGVYDSPEANAFATGWNKNSALVAVSTGLLDEMNPEEVEGVLGHEIAHIANGDMVTLALIQGVVNTFVIFFARIAAYGVQVFFARDSEEGAAIGGMAYYVVAFVFEIVFGIIASMIVMAFSRHREYRADAGSARFLGAERMVLALQRLQALQGRAVDPRGEAFRAMKISDKGAFLGLFSSHPPLEKRIAALRASAQR
jgi:heat shock protein HtpX